MTDHFKISRELSMQIMAHLSRRPYGEVAKIANQLAAEIDGCLKDEKNENMEQPRDFVEHRTPQSLARESFYASKES